MIEIDEFVERLCRLGAHKGPRRFPRKPRDRSILMKSIIMGLDSSKQYSEPELNALLAEWCANVAPEIEVDVTTLRRLLVDYGEVERTRDGAIYEVGFPGRPVAFDLEIEELDLRATVAAYRMGRKPARPPRLLAPNH